jgi:histidinol phosphatase-like enzyme
MQKEIESAGGKIDKIYFCSDLEETSSNRKPNPGMGLQAIKDLSGIDITKAIMVGNTISDMEFGRNLGIKTVFLPTTRPEVSLTDKRIDASYHSLLDFAKAL